MLRIVGAIGLIQLAFNALGLKKGYADGLSPEVPGYPVRSADEMRRRHWLEGTALSAPTAMMIVQAVAVTLLLVRRRPPVAAARTLGVLGALMSMGYPVERIWRESFVDPDPKVTPLTAGGFVLALAMAILGWSTGRGGGRAR
ncbi:hypothetical protein [Agromyces sp. ZXT2-6]|uniref:hypothetical protein n=1 Tax=Agromyces sp. ZXT2-6 TaxID=3461153 RepID=UPI004054CD6B